jgi:two-component system invasion response regulator UvrY
MTKIALADDHILMRRSLANSIATMGDFEVVLEANNGQDLFDKLQPASLPDIIVVDIHMPIMDGFETAKLLRQRFPLVKVLALSMHESEQTVLRMLRCGARGYILKDIEPSEFRQALKAVAERGFYYSELVSARLIHNLNKMGDAADTDRLPIPNGREKEFLQLVCSELTYKEIADKMCLSPRTIDGYRDALFEKLNVHTRVGLALYAIRNGLVNFF